MFPDQPDRHTRETATIPKMMATVNSRVVPGPASSGVTMRTAATTAPIRARPAMTSGSRFNASGIGLSTPVDSQESPASLARPAFFRCSSRASRMTARKTTSVTASWRTLNPTTELTMPRTTPAPKATGRFSIRAMTAAASAGSNRVGPAAAVRVRPWDGALTITVRAARAPAMIHTSVDNRLTGMPSNRARSELSATDRMATPASVRNRNQPSPMSTTGTTMAMSRSSPLNSTGWMLTWNRVSGVGRPPTSGGPCNQPGTSSWMPPNTWARPMVATSTMSRGALKNRSIRKFTPAPTMPPMRIPAPRAMNQFQCSPRSSITPMVPARPPMAP